MTIKIPNVPKIFESAKLLNQFLQSERTRNLKIGFVPTMGALHLGHQKLLEKARSENDVLVLSIFVNRTQFNDIADFQKYPVTWDSDLAIAQKTNVDLIFNPSFSEMYPDDFSYQVSETKLSLELCGKSRPGHFDGVLTVVMKFLQIIQPNRVYFGEKDYQQLSLIEGMIKSFFLDIQLISVSTVRESDGLAMSSRNIRLTADERQIAPLFYKTLITASNADEAYKILEYHGFRVDYVEDRKLTDGKLRRFGAVYIGSVRLIDNVSI